PAWYPAPERSAPATRTDVAANAHDAFALQNMSRQTARSLLLPSLALVAFLLLTWPVWRWLWNEWMGNDYYSHGVLIVPVSLFLAYQRFRHDPALRSATVTGSNEGLYLLGVSLALYLYFLNNKAYYAAAFAMIGLIAGLVWTIAGTQIVRKLVFPIGYLVFMVPVPIIERTTYPLAIFTGVCSTGMASFLGLELTVNGNAVSLPNTDLVIGAQCSGINSIISLTALAALAAYLLDGPLLGRLSLVLMAVPLAMIGNILRVASLLFVADAFGSDAAFTFYHNYSGPIFFVISLGLLLPISRLFHCSTLRSEVI
ncbi:MAG: exosortase/archaeosortase family protein, partial [Caldilineaceae bacterium]